MFVLSFTIVFQLFEIFFTQIFMVIIKEKKRKDRMERGIGSREVK